MKNTHYSSFFIITAFFALVLASAANAGIPGSAADTKHGGEGLSEPSTRDGESSMEGYSVDASGNTLPSEEFSTLNDALALSSMSGEPLKVVSEFSNEVGGSSSVSPPSWAELAYAASIQGINADNGTLQVNTQAGAT